MAKRIGELDVGTNVVAADKVIVQQGGVDNQVVASELPVPLNYIAGLITSNNTTDSDNDIDIAPGIAKSDDDAETMRLASILTKQIDAAWAVGDDAGGLDAGSVVADQLYAIWLIKRSDSGVVDALFMRYATLAEVTTVDADTTDDSYNDSGSGLDIFEPGQTVLVEGFTDPANNGLKTVVSSTAAKLVVSENLVTEAAGDTITISTVGPAMPANYDLKRLIGAIFMRTGPVIEQYIQTGDRFEYTGDYVNDVVSAAITTGAFVTGVLSAPPNSIAEIYGNVTLATYTTGGVTFSLTRKGAFINNQAAFIESDLASGATFLGAQGQIFVNDHRQVDMSATFTTGTLTATILTHGFTMLTRSNP